MASSFPNRYPGPCGGCGHTVPAGAGTVSKVNGKWVAAHQPGGCLTTPVPVKVDLSTVVAPAEGYYLIDDDTVVRVYLTRNKRFATKTLVLPLPGQKKGRWQYTGIARFPECTADKELNIVTAAAFGLRFKVCARCGIVLTHAKSQAVGYGPDCALLLGVPHSYSGAPALSDLPAAKAADDLADEWGDLAAVG